MELEEYLKVFKKYGLFLIVIALFGSILAFFYTQQLPSGYKSTQTFYLTPQTSSTNLESFYAQEKARNFTDSAVAIAQSADFQAQILDQNQSLTVRKLAPQVLQINTFAQDQQGAQELMRKTTQRFNEKFDSDLQELGSAQTPSFTSPSKIVYAAAGFVAGLAFAIFTVSLKTYFKI